MAESKSMVLPRLFLRRCRSKLFRKKLADSSGVVLTGGSLLMRTLVLRRVLLRSVLAADERFVAVLLPPSVGGVVVNAALPLCGRIAVNLNYTATSDTLNYCIRQCGIRHVLTSRRFMEKMNFQLDAEMVYLEDFKDRATLGDKTTSAFRAYCVPSAVLDRTLGLTKIQGDDILTVIFTSGSTGMPKGVMLTYDNIGSNIAAIDQVIRLSSQDVLVGIVPFFHSLGYTVTVWAVLALDVQGIYHYSPLEAKQIGKLCQEHGGTILISTPTFLRSYLRRCTKEELGSLDVVVAGAEKLPVDLSAAFDEKFGVRPVEGYGTTELSPLVSVNIPPSRTVPGGPEGLKEGTVGRPVPGVSVKVVHPETGEDLGVDQPGLLLVKGPNVMRGYLGQPEMTAKVMRDGWYVTGDIAIVDAEGFIHITGRQSRFSKIGGEMVPHIKIEEMLQQILSADEQKLCVAVTALPDERKGERLIVLHTHTDKRPEQISKELAAAHLPNLWIPSPDSFFEVAEIPVLGTGKLDLQKVKQLAQEKVSATAKS